MDLWIRSQDKHRLLKPNRLHVKVDTNTKEGYIFESANSMRYGTYETEERALEVLDEIHEHQEFMLGIYSANGNGDVIRNCYNSAPEYIKQGRIIYEMPQE